MSLTVNPNDLQDALRFVEKVTGRSMADSMNRAGLHSIIGSKSYPGAMQMTTKATRASIMRTPDSAIAGFVISRAKKAGKWPLTTKEIWRQVKAERRRRIASIGFAAYPGYNNAAKAMGGRGIRKAMKKGFSKSTAAKGRGTKATPLRIRAEFTNTAHNIESPHVNGQQALQKGLDNAAKDLVDYGNKVLQRNFNKVKP